ncbi:MAG: hypothetical protein IJ730_07240 [Alphaproteobacteria bacterium]|nr:hypothetical protein [Alphaproteobacteria bacterium]
MFSSAWRLSVAMGISIVLGFSSVSFADEGRILVADSVKVKQTSKNSLLAKEQALNIARKKAFFNLLKNRLEINVNSSVSAISAKEISDCVYDYSIDQEKHSASIYICEVSYRFDEDKVLAVLDKYGVYYQGKKTDQSKNKNCLRLALYTTDYIKLVAKNFDCVVEKFTSRFVIVRIKNCTLEEFRKQDIKYAQL